MANHPKTIYGKVHSVPRLFSAWQHVYQNGIKSKSEQTREAVKAFSSNSFRNIQKISRNLRGGVFNFDPSEGIPISRGKKAPRPIVRSSIKDRVVQRSILDALQEEHCLGCFFDVPTSFGGIKDKKVSDAIEMAYKTIMNGKKYYIRSDIEGFFTKIPRKDVVKKIEDHITDDRFITLLKNATATELSNLAELKNDKLHDLFPIYDIGVAQGCCLSPLIGNLLLNNFDCSMNGRDIVCLRYIDDFLILGPTLTKVKAAFKSAQKILSQIGLRAYDPQLEKVKAETGCADQGLEFLGCEIRPGLIRPNRKSQNRLLKLVEERLVKSLRMMGSQKRVEAKKHSFIQAFFDINNFILGWGNQYAFCNDVEMQASLDTKIDQYISEYTRGYLAKRTELVSLHELNKVRRLLGVHLISDSKKDPIIH